MVVRLIIGDDPILVGEAITKSVDELVADGDRSLMLEMLTEADYRNDDGDWESAKVLDAARTPPFLTERRVVVGRHLSRFSKKDEYTPIVQMLGEPLDTTDLVLVWEKGVEPKGDRMPALPKALKEAAVALVRDARGIQQLLGFVVADAGIVQEASEASLRASLAETLPHYMIPTRFIWLDALPRTSFGKVDRKRLPELVPDAPAGGGAYEPPEGEREATLAAAFRDTLRVDRIGRSDHFFELGGDSILAMQVVWRAKQSGLKIRTSRFVPKPPNASPTTRGPWSVRFLCSRRSVGSSVAGSPPLTTLVRRCVSASKASLILGCSGRPSETSSGTMTRFVPTSRARRR